MLVAGDIRPKVLRQAGGFAMLGNKMKRLKAGTGSESTLALTLASGRGVSGAPSLKHAAIAVPVGAYVGCYSSWPHARENGDEALHEPPLSRPAATLSPPCGGRAGRGVPIWFMVPMHAQKRKGALHELASPP